MNIIFNYKTCILQNKFNSLVKDLYGDMDSFWAKKELATWPAHIYEALLLGSKVSSTHMLVCTCISSANLGRGWTEIKFGSMTQ